MKTKINWKQKLSSRKFWAAVVSFATAICGAFSLADTTAAKIALIIGGIGSLCVYMLSEGHVDSARINTEELYETTDRIYGIDSGTCINTEKAVNTVNVTPETSEKAFPEYLGK